MKAVSSGAIKKIFEYAAEGPEEIIGGFSVSAVKSGEDYNLALVPFGDTSPERMRVLAENVIRMIDEKEEG